MKKMILSTARIQVAVSLFVVGIVTMGFGWKEYEISKKPLHIGTLVDIFKYPIDSAVAGKIALAFGAICIVTSIGLLCRVNSLKWNKKS